jgi:hypothetical protein
VIYCRVLGRTSGCCRVLKKSCVARISMEQWRRELNEALQQGLESESDEEFQEALVQDMFQHALGESSSPPERPKFGGSRPGRRYVYREREACHERLYQDYFAEDPIYDAMKFRRRFRMRRELFLYIVEQVCTFDPWFVQKCDALGRLGLSSLQKCTAAIRMLAYGIPADGTDEYCRTGESTALEAMKRFVVAIRGCFQSTYLREPTQADFQRQIDINRARGFPGMFGSLDCMHWTWKNCPVAWQGQFQDKDGDRSLILEAIADQSLWIWHAFSGLPGGNNDINVLDRSPLLSNLLQGAGHDMTFEVNGHVYNRYYLLTDGIYPQWSCFLQPIHEPQGEKKEHYTKMQSGARKDVERAFGVLQARWEIVKNPYRQWELDTMNNIILCCIILHNMIIEDEQGQNFEPIFYQAIQGGGMWRGLSFRELNAGTRELENMEMHLELRNDIMDHLWHLRGEGRY